LLGPLSKRRVTEELEALGNHNRPGLAAAVALAEILDNPRAVSTKPAAAKLADLLKQLRKNTVARTSKLAAVRALTSVNVVTRTMTEKGTADGRPGHRCAGAGSGDVSG
jgi:hypothetical protein